MKRVGYLIGMYLLTVVLFIVGKALFMLYNNPMEWSNFFDVAQHGLSLDLSTALYCVIVPLIVILISLFPIKWEKLRKSLKVYHFILAIVLTLAICSDTVMFSFWGIKLDASMLQFLSQPSGITQSVSLLFLIITAAVMAMAVYIIYKVYNMLLPSEMPVLSMKWRIIGLLLFICAIPLVVIGIRGGTGESTTNVGQVYFSQKQFLNYAAVNPLFSFLASFEKSANRIEEYDYMPAEEAQEIVSRIYPISTADSIISLNDSLMLENWQTHSADSSSASIALLNTRRPNIVIILLESCGGMFTRLLGRDSIMPHFNALMDEGVSFNRCYANTWRTDRGTVCTFGGYPSFPRSSVMKMPKKTALMPAIPKTLAAYGYHSEYLYGGDINFTNMRSYLINAGFEQLYSMDDFTQEERKSAKWGVRDDITFKRLLSMIRSQSKDTNYILGFSTLSSHEPWDVPEHVLTDEIDNSFHYLDRCIGDFIDSLKTMPQWSDLLVIMLPDHSIGHAGYDETNIDRNLIPMVWLGGAVKSPKQIEVICNQTDLAATLLSQLGITHGEYTFSRDVLSPAYRWPLAVHNFTDGFSLIDSTGYIVYDFNADKIIVNKSSAPANLEKAGKAILQVTTDNFKNIK